MAGSGARLKSALAFLGLAAGIVAFFLLVQNKYYLDIANNVGLNAILVVGLNLLIGYAGQVSLGHAAFYGLGAYVSAILTVTYGVSPWLGVLIALVVTGLVALAIGVPTLKLHGHYLVMATLGFNLIVNIVLVQWDKVTGGPSGFPGVPSLAVGPWAFDSDRSMFLLIWGTVFASIVLALNLVNSRVGRGLRALHGSEAAATAMGVPTDTYKVKVFILSALYAAMAGSLYAHYRQFVSPKTFDIFFSVELVTMVIVGGMGSVWGTLFGATFLTLLPKWLEFFVHSFDQYKDVLYGSILVLILVFLPEGLFIGITRGVNAVVRSLSGRRGEEAAASIPPYLGPAEREPAPALSVETAAVPHHDRPSPVVATGVRGREPILRVQNVTMRFGGLVALGIVSFDLTEGSIAALIGPNGAGKTTLINVVSGVYRPQRGSVLLDGRDTRRVPAHRMAGLGMTRTFQNIQILGNMTVLENVMVGLHAKTSHEFVRCLVHGPRFHREEKQIEQRAWEALHLFSLDAKAAWLASALSYGEQKRIEMARAVVSRPRLLLLDEPVAGLNMTETREIAFLIGKIRSQGISILLVEHDMNLVMSISDRIVVLDYGIKIAEGTPEVIQRDEKVLSAYLGAVD